MTSATDTRNFYGFRDVVFDKVVVAVQSFDHALLLDNLQIEAVPEPASWALMLGGLGAVGALKRRRRP